MSTAALPGGYTLHSPQAKPQPHLFGDTIIVPEDLSVSGYEQAERTCRNCGAVKVTVLGPGLSWRAWRACADGPQDIDPPTCPQAQGTAS